MNLGTKWQAFLAWIDGPAGEVIVWAAIVVGVAFALWIGFHGGTVA